MDLNDATVNVNWVMRPFINLEMMAMFDVVRVMVQEPLERKHDF